MKASNYYKTLVVWLQGGEWKERGFRGDQQEERAKVLIKRLLKDGVVDMDGGERRIDAYLCPVREPESTSGFYYWDNDELDGWAVSQD